MAAVKIVNIDGKEMGKDALRGAKGWITDDGMRIVLVPLSTDHYDPVALRAIGVNPTSPSSDAFAGNVRFIAGYAQIFLQGDPGDIETVKYLVYDLFGDRTYIVDNHRGEYLGEFHGSEFLDTDFYEVGSFTRYRGAKRGRGWWDDRPRHREAALKRKYL